MSNLAPSPVVEECRPSAQQPARLEAQPERIVHLGSLPVRRLLPVRGRRLIGPWCFLDRFGPLQFQAEKVMDVAPHPHIGLQTVSWLFHGEIIHNDSLDNECLVRPGQLSLMTAGRGIAHTEETPRDNSGILDGVQLWVALPHSDREMQPMYQCTASQPSVEMPGCVATAILGEYAGATSAGRSFSPCLGADINVHKASQSVLPLKNDFEYGLILTSGDAEAFGENLRPDILYHLGVHHGELPIRSRDGARLLLVGGVPFGETILMWWNFVARTTEEIVRAREAWQRRELAGDVPRYQGPRLAAPEFLGRPIPS